MDNGITVAATKNKRGRPTVYERDGRGWAKDIIEMSDGLDRSKTNLYYEFEGQDIVKEAASKIPEAKLIYFAPGNMMELTRREIIDNGYVRKQAILEQIGRMRLQDGYDIDSCEAVVKVAGLLLKAGCTVKEVTSYIQRGRSTNDWDISSGFKK